MTKNNTYLFILGSHPQLSFAELEAVLRCSSEDRLELRQSVALYTTPQLIDAGALMKRLGGTIKIVEMLGVFDEEKISAWLLDYAQDIPSFHFGFSLYAGAPDISLKKHWPTLHRLGLSIKKILKEDGVRCRFVESKEVALSSVIVQKEHLLDKGVDIVLVKDANGLTFGKTLAVQPFKEFSQRDYGRPSRDTHSGMLPPKVARMMVNLAQPEPSSVILDPFCGSGTILQEAFLLGHKQVLGSDSEKRAIEDTKKNLEWLKAPAFPLYIHDARRLIADRVLATSSVDRIIFEGFLGPTLPSAQKIPPLVNSLTTFYEEVLSLMEKLLRPDGKIVVALPFWSVHQREQYLPIETILRHAHLKKVRSDLFYRRSRSTVGRHILVLEKK